MMEAKKETRGRKPVKDKKDYLTIYQFRADRKMIEILSEVDAELRDAVADAEQAQQIITKLNQTSDLMDISLEDETE